MEKEPKIPTSSPEEEFKLLTEEEKERRKEIRKKLVSAIHELLKQEGFKKQSSTWRRELKDIIQVVNLQRSDFAFSFYLNLGIFIKKINPDVKNPRESQCHYRKRFEKISAEDETDREEIIKRRKNLDFEDTSTTAEEKITKLKEIIENRVLQFFSQHNSIESVEKLNILRSARRILNE